MNWRALLSLVIGGGAAMLWIDAQYYFPAYYAPLSKATGGGDLSWLAGLVVGGLLYYLLSMRSVPAEQASSELEEAA